jgi:hypothetical protein
LDSENDIQNINPELLWRIKNTALIPKEIKEDILSKKISYVLSKEIESFFDEYWAIESEILWKINEEMPHIIKKMQSHIESKTRDRELLEISNISNDILLA